jgi:hypothetical protein
VAIIKWIRRFVATVKPYVDKIIPPHLSGVCHVDELIVHVRKENMKKASINGFGIC